MRRCVGLSASFFILIQLTKTKLLKHKEFLGFIHTDILFIVLINDKMPTTVDILTFKITLILCSIEHKIVV